jgi:hypothetical protein
MELKAIKAKNSIKILYIMGYGRSGSTITDILLHQHPETFSVGALNNIYQWFIRDELCACGETVNHCSFWNDVTQQAGITSQIKDLAPPLKLQSLVEDIWHFRSLLQGKLDASQTKKYAHAMEALFSSIADVGNTTVIIDSSKSTRDCTGRALALHRHTNLDIKVLHLIRDGRGVAWSAMKSAGSEERKRLINLPFFNFIRTTLSWTLVNWLARITIKALPSESVMTLKYEDLCANPASALKRVGDFVTLDFQAVSDDVLQGKELAISHNLGGNRVRFTKKLTFRPDETWPDTMPLFYQRLFWMISGWLATQLGYLKYNNDKTKT